MNIVGKRIRERREFLRLSQEELAQLTGYKGKSAISRIESENDSNSRKLKFQKIKTFAKVLNTTPEYLMGWTNETENLSPASASVAHIPVYTPVAAGTGTYADNDIIGYEDIPTDWVDKNNDYRIVTVTGDSMYPEFQDGDHVLVRVQSSVDSGDYAVVLIDGDSAVIKKVTYGDDWIELVSVNPMYPPRRFENEDVLNVRVFGLVKKSWRCY